MKLPAGTTVYLGTPAKPLPQQLVREIVDVLASYSDGVEAHAPQCFVPGVMKAAAVVLVIVLSSDDLYGCWRMQSRMSFLSILT